MLKKYNFHTYPRICVSSPIIKLLKTSLPSIFHYKGLKIPYILTNRWHFMVIPCYIGQQNLENTYTFPKTYESLFHIQSHYLGLQVSHFSQDIGTFYSNLSLLKNTLKLPCISQETKILPQILMAWVDMFNNFPLVFFSLTSCSMGCYISILFPGDGKLYLAKFNCSTLLF